MATTVKLPEATKERLIQLLQLLQNYPEQKITSVKICSLTGWNANLVRHDFWLINCPKGVSNGYFVTELVLKIEEALNRKTEGENEKFCCIVGLGRLGAALLDNEFTEGTDLKIKAGFDSNLNRVEILRSTFPLYPASEMSSVIRKEKIEYAILTVKEKDAQQMAEKLVKAGIKGIVNMTRLVLKLPSEVKVQNVCVTNALQLVM